VAILFPCFIDCSRIVRGDLALESAAASLAAIHTAKQVHAEAGASRCPGGGAQAPSDLRLPLGDVLFGVAQLQVDFARKLFEFNKRASARLRERLHRAPSDVAPIRVRIPHSNAFTIRNTASLSKTFRLRLALSHAPQGVVVSLDPAEVTVAAGKPSANIAVVVTPHRPGALYTGHVLVESRGVLVERVPIEIGVSKT
jgi:hypothetical protein